MKALCNIVNLFAMVMVLLLGTVSVHAHDHAPVIGGEYVDALGSSVDHDHGETDAHPTDDRSMHCGAPMLGASTINMGCVLRVASVVYAGEGIVSITDIASKNLRPPRR